MCQQGGSFYRLDRADLVIGVHNGYQCRMFVNGSVQLSPIYYSLIIYRHNENVEAPVLKEMSGVKYGMVLDRGNYEPIAVGICGRNGAEQR
jgi:hypothetical protein